MTAQGPLPTQATRRPPAPAVGPASGDDRSAMPRGPARSRRPARPGIFRVHRPAPAPTSFLSWVSAIVTTPTRSPGALAETGRRLAERAKAKGPRDGFSQTRCLPDAPARLVFPCQTFPYAPHEVLVRLGRSRRLADRLRQRRKEARPRPQQSFRAFPHGRAHSFLRAELSLGRFGCGGFAGSDPRDQPYHRTHRGRCLRGRDLPDPERSVFLPGASGLSRKLQARRARQPGHPDRHAPRFRRLGHRTDVPGKPLQGPRVLVSRINLPLRANRPLARFF